MLMTKFVNTMQVNKFLMFTCELHIYKTAINCTGKLNIPGLSTSISTYYIPTTHALFSYLILPPFFHFVLLLTL